MEVNFKENLKTLRSESKLTQSDFAKKLNTTVKTVSHWETGYSEPSIAQIIEISNFFKISTDELLTK